MSGAVRARGTFRQDPLLQKLAEDYVDDADLSVRLDRLFEARKRGHSRQMCAPLPAPLAL